MLFRLQKWGKLRGLILYTHIVIPHCTDFSIFSDLTNTGWNKYQVSQVLYIHIALL